MQLQEFPGFQGQLLVDDFARQSVATDWGHHFRKVPLAVVRPKTAQDVAHAVAYAGKEGINTTCGLPTLRRRSKLAEHRSIGCSGKKPQAEATVTVMARIAACRVAASNQFRESQRD
jgi:hypothetical protein